MLPPRPTLGQWVRVEGMNGLFKVVFIWDKALAVRLRSAGGREFTIAMKKLRLDDES